MDNKKKSASKTETLGPKQLSPGKPHTQTTPVSLTGTRASAAICLLLVIGISAVYWQVRSHDFVSFDDLEYIKCNVRVQAGITLENVSWAFGFTENTYWHPLTWLSHMLDCDLFGLNPGAHHMVNLFFHILNSVLLFLSLMLMTGERWKSAFVAGLFALHPVNVDSVAWVAERKNLLSTFFWMLTMIGYFSYTRRPGVIRYMLFMVAFILGLLAKPTIATLPFVLLLLDYWPLGRFRIPAVEQVEEGNPNSARVPLSRLIIEKIPLFILSAAAVVISSQAIRHGGFTITTDIVPMGLRVENAIVSYVVYIGKMLWPADLTFFYPYPDAIELWKVIGSAGILGVVSFLALRSFSRARYFLVGWLWFLGTLVPMTGLLQGGLWPAIAERWVYVPFIGLFMIAAWGIPGLIGHMGIRKEVLPVTACAVLIVLMALAWKQTGHWKDDVSFFSHAVRVDPGNFVAQSNLGQTYARLKKYEEAIYHMKQGLKINRNDTMILNNLGSIYTELGNRDEAIRYYTEAIRYRPDEDKAYYELGLIHAEAGDLNKAAERFSQVIRINPGSSRAYYNLGVVLARKGEMAGAASNFSEALKIDPDDADAHSSYGILLMNQGRMNEASAHFMEAVRADPGNADAQRYLSAVLKHKEKAHEEIAALERKSTENPRDAVALYKLAVAYSRLGEGPKSLDALFRILKIQPEKPDVYYNIACIYAKQGEAGKSVEWLKKSIDKGFRDWKLMRGDPDLALVRETEQYKTLVEDVAK